jgi:hypothetical protein
MVRVRVGIRLMFRDMIRLRVRVNVSVGIRLRFRVMIRVRVRVSQSWRLNGISSLYRIGLGLGLGLKLGLGLGLGLELELRLTPRCYLIDWVRNIKKGFTIRFNS